MFLLAFTFSVSGASSTFPLLGKTIIIDAGHGKYSYTQQAIY